MSDSLKTLRERHPNWGRREWSELAHMNAESIERLSCEDKLLKQQADINADFIRQYQVEVTKYREALDSIVHMAVIGPYDEWVDIAEMIGLVRLRAEKALALVSEEPAPDG